jgi:hypothetical protein
MTYKIIDTREKKTMTKRQGEAIMTAYERYDSDAITIKTPQREHLGGQFVPGYSCDHDWGQLNMEDAGAKEFLQMKFDETELGDQQMICSKCKAFSLWESGELFAYDAIVIEEEKENNKTRRSRK